MTTKKLIKIFIPRDLHQHDLPEEYRTSINNDCIFTACYEDSDIGESDSLVCSLYGHEISGYVAALITIRLKSFLEQSNFNNDLRKDNLNDNR